MNRREISRSKYQALLDDKGRMIALHDRIVPSANWISELPGDRFGVPFVHGTQGKETYVTLLESEKPPRRSSVMASCKHGIPFPGRPGEGDEPAVDSIRNLERHEAAYVSHSGRTAVIYSFFDEYIEMEALLTSESGPRNGLELDFQFIDRPTGEPWTRQAMLNTIYTDELHQYAYFIFQRPEGGYLALLVDSPYAAFRLKYSVDGHKVTGMQLLNVADDLVILDDRRLHRVERLNLKLAFTAALDEAYAMISELLGIAIAGYNISGGGVGSAIPVELIGSAEGLQVVQPNGKTLELNPNEARHLVTLGSEGEHRIETTASNGRIHVSRVFCHGSWQEQFDRINAFSRQYFQLDSGAFARVIWKDTLSPKEGRTYGGEAFGDSEEQISCRTGEFGGFAGWAMLKNMLLYGEHPELRESVDRYIRSWALNEGHEEWPNYGTICKRPFGMFGMQYSAYHLYQEYNYPQYETWLIAQLTDYYTLTRDPVILDHLLRLGKHYINDHVDPIAGMVLDQNHAEEEIVDYTTVDTPLVHLTRLGKLLEREGHPDSELFLGVSLKMAKHLAVRGLIFPTEGESCTEDGSMACTALSLLFAYLELEKDESFLKQGQYLLQLHAPLEMKGFDSRMKGSSMRYWETLYETRDWGASINASHAWAIWTAEAKLLLFAINGGYRWLEEAYNSFIANMGTVDGNGGIHCCYTPDMIPATPHMPYNRSEAEEPDIYPTSIPLASGYTALTYSASGNYYLIKAAEYWNHISGIDAMSGAVMNGRFDGEGRFESFGSEFDTLGLKGLPPEPIHLRVKEGQELRIRIDLADLDKDRELHAAGGRIIERLPGELVLAAEGNIITLF